jgi:hypothetical protein
VVQSNKHKPVRVFFRIHRRDATEILAICDEDLFGKVLSNDKIRMKVPIKFYKGQSISIADAFQLMRRYVNINILGSVIELGIEKKQIKKDAVIWFNDEEGKRVPHLLMFSIPPL